MFFLQAHITISSTLSLPDLADLTAKVLSINSFKLDISGRYEGAEVYRTTCLGLEFQLASDDPPLVTFQLMVNSNVDEFEFDGSESEIDGVQYLLYLLRRGEIDAGARDPALLYGP